ncbi:MAG: 2,3-bisphosphoglycerate-independent phosphoglycerate mutase [Candidatus Paceibacterota bacterium]
MNIALIVIDGLGDRPIAELQNQTPLEAASTPNLDSFAEQGSTGLVDTFYLPDQGYPRSDTSHLALFGYNAQEDYLGRGPYEVAGIGMNLQEGDVALRANFGTVDDELVIKDRRAGRISETQELVDALQEIEIKGVKFLIKKAYGHRAGLIMRSDKKLSAAITNGDPHQTEVEVNRIEPKEDSEAAMFTAEVLNDFLEKAHNILKNHSFNKKREEEGKLPGNYLLVRGAGQLKNVESFSEKYGLKSACIAGGALYKGVGKLIGMDLIEVAGDTGLPSTDLEAKFEATARNVGKYDFVFTHVKPVDNLAEDGNYQGKKKFIEKIDKAIKPVLNLNKTLVAITADHSTCCDLKRHCVDPVPLLIHGAGKDEVTKFSEKACKEGALGKLKQKKVMDKLLDLSTKG